MSVTPKSKKFCDHDDRFVAVNMSAASDPV